MAKDKYHDHVKEALVRDGWIITHDPYYIPVGRSLDGFEDALGQFIIYHMAIEEKEPSRILYLALPQSFYDRFFDDQFFIRLANRYEIKMIVFDEEKKTITSWKK